MKLFLDFAILIMKKIFQITILDWENIYLLPQNIISDSNTRLGKHLPVTTKHYLR